MARYGPRNPKQMSQAAFPGPAQWDAQGHGQHRVPKITSVHTSWGRSSGEGMDRSRLGEGSDQVVIPLEGTLCIWGEEERCEKLTPGGAVLIPAGAGYGLTKAHEEESTDFITISFTS